ncbi:MAG: 6-bladed beta-propeller [Rhodothermaceae bacterium]
MNKLTIKVFFLVCCLFISCKESKKQEILSEYKFGYTLHILDSLEYKFEGSNPIVFGSQIEHFKDKILITDKDLNSIFIFSEELEFEHKIGGKGRGPGEYLETPRVILEDSSIILQDQLKIDRYNSQFELISSKTLPAEFTFPLNSVRNIKQKDKLVMNVWTDKYLNFNEYSPICVLDDDNNIEFNIGKWDDVYLNEKYSAFCLEQSRVLFSKVSENKFFAKQQASRKIQLFENFELVEEFYYSPKFFRKIPEVTIKEYQKNLETFFKFVPTITYNYNLCYDHQNQYVIISYFHTAPVVKKGLNIKNDKTFITVFDKYYNCIYDGVAPGYLEFIKNGELYFKKLKDNGITLIKCKVKYRSERNGN